MTADPTPLWRDTAAEAVAPPPLTQDAVCDVAVIGGGFAGVSAALHAAEAGASVRLLEAHRIAHGGSGRNVGLVNAGLWLPPGDVCAALGQAEGERLNAALAAAPDLVFSLIAAHAIDCEAMRAGTLHCAHAPSGLRDLRRRHAQGVARGAPLTLLDAEQASARTGARGMHGALHDARAGTIQPLAFCAGLARAAMAAGAALHDETPALRVARDGDVWRIETPGGTVRAGALIMTTNAYHQGAAGAPPPPGIPVRYFQMATDPLPADLRAAILPGAEGAWDTALIMTSFRTDAAGRLILGAIGAPEGIGAPIHHGWAARKLARLFPALAGRPFVHGWSGRIAMTPDHIPRIVRLGPRGYGAFGWSGRGIGPGVTFGRALAQAVVGAVEDGLPLAPTDASAAPLAALRAAGIEAGARAAHLTGARL